MLYCVNPICSNPWNPDENNFCIKCGQILTPLFRNRFRVIRLLGEGGFSRTYEARDTDRMDEPCVIKQFVPQIQGTTALEKATELFKQEAKRLYELGEHPQIPRLVAYFEQDQRLYLVQEFIEGQTLLEELQLQGVFSEEKITQLLTDLLPILKFIHERGVIHRDIKPENIMRRRQDGKLILIDFGVSKHATQTVLSKTGTTVGTFGYAPLEQMRGQVYPASDLYSLGVTCIRLLTECLPNEEGYDQLYDALKGRWLWRKHLPKGTSITKHIEKILDKLIQDYVKNRYQSADEVLETFNYPIFQPSSLIKKIPAKVVTLDSNNLSSAVGIDYSQLRYLLTHGEWREADMETMTIMLKLSNRQKEGWLRIEDIDRFFCEDLSTIDQLWLKFSYGRFGFTVQKEIYESLGGNTNYNPNIWDCFGDRVGWRLNHKWLYYNQLSFTLHSRPGNLPRGICFHTEDGNWKLKIAFIASRLASCNIK